MSSSRLVYSTGGNDCTHCGKSLRKCQCEATAQRTSSDGIIRIRRETKGRKGKGVCIVTGLELPEEEIKALAKKLKALCGTGGTAKDGVIEIQGDHRETLLAALSKQFKNVKLAGG